MDIVRRLRDSSPAFNELVQKIELGGGGTPQELLARMKQAETEIASLYRENKVLYNKIENIEEKDYSQTADWNENDPTQMGYIRNRPFYKEVLSEGGEVLNTLLSFQRELGGFNFTDENINISVGGDYIVNWGGVEYECTAFGLYGSTMLGNGALMYAGDDTGEPFCIELITSTSIYVYKNTSTTEDVSIVITGVEKANINKIPEEYLPAGIGGGSYEHIVLSDYIGDSLIMDETQNINLDTEKYDVLHALILDRPIMFELDVIDSVGDTFKFSCIPSVISQLDMSGTPMLFVQCNIVLYTFNLMLTSGVMQVEIKHIEQ